MFWVKVNGEWKEATSWLKVNNEWKKSTATAKVDGIWKPGQKIELYSPGVESLRSSNYNVEVFNGTQFSSAYVFSGARTAIAVYGLDNPTGTVGPSNPYKNKLWLSGSKPVMSYLTFGTDNETSVRVSKPGTSITSIDIRPRSKNIPYRIYNGSAIVQMSPGDKAWITVNNELSSPLFVFADNLKPPIPTTGNYYYFAPGIHDISAINAETIRTFVSKADGVSTKTFNGVGWSSFPGYIEGQPYTIYLDGGAYVKGTLNIQNKNNLRIIGPGILAGDNVDGEYFQDYNYFRSYEDLLTAQTVMIRGNTTYDDIKGGLQDFTAELGFPYVGYNFSGTPSGVIVSGITIVNTPWYSLRSINQISNIKIISPWMYSSDGPSLLEDRSTKFSSFTDSFLFVADDALYPPANTKSFHPNAPYQGGSSILSGLSLYSFNNGPIVLTYTGFYYFDQVDKSYPCLIYDLDIGSYARNRDSETPIRLTTDNRFKSNPANYGFYDVTLSNIRVEDPIDTALFWLGNIPDPFANGDLTLGDRGDEYGATSGIIFANITASGTNTQISGNPIWGKDQSNRPYNITFKNIKINDEYVTDANKNNYIRWYREYDPYLINSYSKVGEVVDVYFYIGDSLAVGVSGFGSQLTGTAYASIADQVTGCYIFRTAPAWDAPTVTGTRFELIRPGDNTWPIDYTLGGPDPYGNMSSESVLCHKLRGISNNRDIYLIKVAKGGTLAFSSVSANGFAAEDWSISSTNEMWSKFQLSANAAITTLRNSGKNPNLRGGVIFLGTNVPNYYTDRAFTSSIIRSEVSSLVYAINNLFQLTNDVAADYTNIVWVAPSKNIGDTTTDYGYYMGRVRAEVSSFTDVYYKHHFYTPSAWDNATYFADFVHPNTSGYVKIAEDLFNIFNKNTSSVTNPSLNPGVNITFNQSIPGLELYHPGTEQLRSPIYSVEVFNGNHFDESYVYSATARFGNNGVSGARAVFSYDADTGRYRNRLWYRNDKPVLSYTTFGTSATARVKVSKVGGTITSADIRPRSKNYNTSINNGQLELFMNPKDKAWITINGDVSNTLFVFCDPLKPEIPSTNSLYFGPGIHHLSALVGAQVINATSPYYQYPGDNTPRTETFRGASYSAFENYEYVEGEPYTIYLDGGAYVIGQFDLRGKNNIKVIGPGILAGDNIVEQCTRFVDDDFHTRSEPYGVLSQLRAVNYAYQEQGLNTYDRVPSGLIVSGPTIVNTHMINMPGMNTIDNVKLLSPFMPNTDIKAPMPDGATSAAIMRDSLIFLGDDAIIPTPYNAYPTNPNTGYLNIGGRFDISGCQVYTTNGGPLVIPYFGVLYPSSTPNAYPIVIRDMDFGIYTYNEGGGGANGVPIDSEHGEVAIRVTMDMSSIYSGTWSNGMPKYGIRNLTVSNIRFDDPIDQALFWVGNVPDPYFPIPVSFRGEEYGHVSGITFKNISVNSIPGFSSKLYSNLIFAKNSTNRPKNITFENIRLDGTYLTNSNYSTYFTLSGIDSTAPNLISDNITFIKGTL